MCIAIMSDRGQGYPKKTVLKRCFKNNPDGAGYAVYLEDEKLWHIKKGYTTWKGFWKAFNKERFSKEDYVVIHFRVGTSGKMVEGTKCHPDCTHPFPASDVDEDLMAHDIKTKGIFVHNGVVGPGKGDLSDTMVAIKEYGAALLPYASNDDAIVRILSEHLKTEKCRWFVADEDQGWLLGDWHEDDGIHYSNKGYLPPQVVKPVSSGKGATSRVGHTYPGSTTYNNTSANYNKYVTYIYCADPARGFMSDRGIGSKIPSQWELGMDVSIQWDWAKWDKAEAIWEEKAKETEKATQKTIEVFNMDNEPLAIVDENGDVIWLDAWESHQEQSHKETTITPEGELSELKVLHGDDHQFDCIMCGNPLELQDVTTDGCCPWCDELLFPQAVDYQPEEDKETCPECGETNYIIDPADGNCYEPNISEATSECCRCGCLWKEDSINGAGITEIIGRNSDTYAQWMSSKEAQGGE
jgi:hypothetical protein